MCGIVCGSSSSVVNSQVEQALNVVASRGPDATTYFREEQVFLGHTLLSLVASSLDLAIQPIWSRDRSVVGCVNGEIYNYKELRSRLEDLGYVFVTESDSEVLIHGIHRYGPAFVAMLDGEFAFVTYNFKEKVWFCGVDRFRSKPLKYVLDPTTESFLVASTAKALVPLGVNLQIDLGSCLFSFASQCLPSGKTMFEGVYTIPPGHTLTVDRNFRAYLNSYSTPMTRHGTQNLEELETLLEAAILKRVPKSGKVAVALSSGVDSSLIAYYLKKNCVDFQSFSVDFLGSSFSESDDVNAYSIRHGIPVDFLAISENILREAFVESTVNAENLSINPHAAGKLLLNRAMVDRGHKVCLTGDGADELFFGYPHFHTHDPYQFIADSRARGNHFKPLLNIDLDTDCIRREAGPSVDAQELYYRYWLADYGLHTLGDSQSAVVGQEHRYPFLDMALHDYVRHRPGFRSHNSPSKQVLRNHVATWDPVTAAIPKRPFTSPVINAGWLSVLQEYVVENTRLRDLNFFDWDRLTSLVTQVFTNTPPNRIVLTQILSLGILAKDVCK